MKICLIGPTYPYRGGISHHTSFFKKNLEKHGHEVLMISFSRQYPSLLFPGKDDRDPAAEVQPDVHYTIDSINPLTWFKTIQQIRSWGPDKVIIQWWHPYWMFCWGYLSRAVKRAFGDAVELIYSCLVVVPHEGSALDRMALQFALKPADRFIIYSEPEAAQLRQLFAHTPMDVTPHPTYAEVGDDDNHANHNEESREGTKNLKSVILYPNNHHGLLRYHFLFAIPVIVFPCMVPQGVRLCISMCVRFSQFVLLLL